MKKIKLTQGKFALVDSCDFEYLNQWKWHYNRYAYHSFNKNGKWSEVGMHRMIINPSDKECVDHINHDKLDNRRSNLRIATNSQNQHNSMLSKINKTGFKGIIWHKRDKRWQVQIRLDGKRTYLGCPTKLQDAIKLYDNCAKKHFGEYAFTNKDISETIEAERRNELCQS